MPLDTKLLNEALALRDKEFADAWLAYHTATREAETARQTALNNAVTKFEATMAALKDKPE